MDTCIYTCSGLQLAKKQEKMLYTSYCYVYMMDVQIGCSRGQAKQAQPYGFVTEFIWENRIESLD